MLKETTQSLYGNEIIVKNNFTALPGPPPHCPKEGVYCSAPLMLGHVTCFDQQDTIQANVLTIAQFSITTSTCPCRPAGPRHQRNMGLTCPQPLINDIQDVDARPLSSWPATDLGRTSMLVCYEQLINLSCLWALKIWGCLLLQHILAWPDWYGIRPEYLALIYHIFTNQLV